MIKRCPQLGETFKSNAYDMHVIWFDLGLARKTFNLKNI